MGFISESLDEIVEAKAAPEGEYDLRITKAEEKPSKKGKNMAVIQFAFVDASVDAPRFNHYILQPDGNDEEQDTSRKREWKRLCTACGVSTDVDVVDLIGEELNSMVMQETGDDNVVRNKVRLPYIKDEAPAATGRRRR
jgi:hypothetical protein